MASSNVRHVRNGVRGVGCLFEWLATGRPMENKLMETQASQGDEGFRNVVEGFVMGNEVYELKVGLGGL